MAKSKEKLHRSIEVPKNEIEYIKLQEIRRRCLYQLAITKQPYLKLNWPMQLKRIKLETLQTFNKRQKKAATFALTPTSSYSTQDFIPKESMNEGKRIKVNKNQLETFSMNRLQLYTEEKLKQLGIQLSPTAFDHCVNNSISLIHTIMEGYVKNMSGRHQKLKIRKSANWKDILFSAMRLNLPKSVIQKAYYTLKDKCPEDNQAREGMEVIMADYLNDKEDDNIGSYLSNSIFGHTTPIEDLLMQKLSEVEDEVYKNEPAYMDITKLNIPDANRIADAVEMFYTNKKV